MGSTMRGLLLVSSGFLLFDAIWSMRYTADQRPLLQYGRAARGLLGLGLGVAGLAYMTPKG